MKLFGGSNSARERGGNNFFHSAVAFLEKIFNIKAIRVITVALAILGLSAIGIATWWKITVKPPDLPPVENLNTDNLPAFDMANPVKPAVTPSESTAAPLNSTGRRDGCYTVVLAGMQGNGDLNTDTLMVGTLDTVNKTFNVVSIPRDTMVNVKRDVKKINAAYAMGHSKGKENAALQMKTEIESIIGFMPDYYAIVNMNGFVKLVDAMGGVTYNVPQDMYKDTGDMVINLKKGERKLSGKQALQLVRFRGYAGKDDFGRMETQQQFLKVVAKQLVSLGNVFKINEFADIAKDNLQTDLDVGDMLWFGKELLSYGMDNVNFHTIPSTPGSYKGTSYVYVDVADALKLINETINPLNRDITEDDLDILIVKS